MMSVSLQRQDVNQALADEPLQDHEALGNLIGDIYDAALDQALWPVVLQRAARFVGGIGASLFARDAVARGGSMHHVFGIGPYYQKQYVERYAGLDRSSNAPLFAGLEQIVATTDPTSYRQSVETRFYREWFSPQSFVDLVRVALDHSASGMAIFGIVRHEQDGLPDAAVRCRMKLLVPHLRRALLLGRSFAVKETKIATFADTFDGLSAALYLVDARGRMSYANQAGQALLAGGDVLRLSGGRLVICERQHDLALSEVLAASGDGDAAPGPKGIALPLTGKCDERYVAHVLPLASGAGRVAGAAAAAAVFVRKMAMVATSPSDVIGTTFKLTPAELRVLLAIVDVGGVPEVAVALGVAETTIKTHLGRLFEKTGASRQADLVKLVAGFANPWSG